MKRVAAREFEEHASEYLDARETLHIERDGEVIGYYVPVKNGTGDRPSANGPIETDRSDTQWSRASPEETRELVERLERTLAKVYAETGMTEDEFADLFDLNKPFPYDD